MNASAQLSDEAVIPLLTLDPAAALDDLEWLDRAVGDARVVAIGESAHYNAEFLRFRHRLVRYLVERHGFSAHAMETGFVESALVDDWVLGGDGELDEVMATGLTSLMGLWTPIREHLEWMSEHNSHSENPVGFHGIDMPGSLSSLLSGLDAVIAYTGEGAHLREIAATFSAESAFTAPAALAAYAALDTATRDALTAGLADLTAHLSANSLDLVRSTSITAYDRARRELATTVALDGMVRALTRGDFRSMMFAREAAIADTVEWILDREERIVLTAHNAHVQRWPGSLPGSGPLTSVGLHLADRLGGDYLVVGTTSGTGRTLNTSPDFYAGALFADLEPPRPGSLDALMAATHDGLFATDLRTLSPADAAVVDAVPDQRLGVQYSPVDVRKAYDVLVHFPHVSAAEPDRAALAHAPTEVQEAFGKWEPEAV